MTPSSLLITLEAAIDNVKDLENAKKLTAHLLNLLLVYGFGEACLLFEYYDSEPGLSSDLAREIAPLLKRDTFGIPPTEKYEFKILLRNPSQDTDIEYLRVPADTFSDQLSNGEYEEEIGEDLFIVGISFSIDFRYTNNFLAVHYNDGEH